jgi:hypothetical protein
MTGYSSDNQFAEAAGKPEASDLLSRTISGSCLQELETRS